MCDDFELFRHEEDNWLCAVEFLPDNDPESRCLGAETIGYLFGYAHLTNTRTLALVGDVHNQAYEILFSFSSPEEKGEFLNFVRTNADMGCPYIERDLKVPTANEVENASPLAVVLPEDVMQQVELIATSLLDGAGRCYLDS
jgi:hypothetical protein